MTLQIYSDGTPLGHRFRCRGLGHAKTLVFDHLTVGYRGVTAEVVDEEGEVIAYYENGFWREVSDGS